MKRIIIIWPDEDDETSFRQSLMALVVFIVMILGAAALAGWLI